MLNPVPRPYLLYIWFLKTFVHTKYSNISLAVFLAQMRWETSNFTLDMYMENKNLFGMRLPKKRKTLAIGENKKHAVFSSFQDSIDDYFLYLDVNKVDASSNDAFIISVARAYNAEVGISTYIARMQQVVKQEIRQEAALITIIKGMLQPFFLPS